MKFGKDSKLSGTFDICYDIETYMDLFCISLKRPDTGERWRFEISDRRNDVQLITQALYYLQSVNARMFGYNNNGFDYPVIHALLKNTNLTALELHLIGSKIINTPWDQRFDNVIYDSDMIVKQGDLYKIHHFDNVARATSLKALEFNMRMDSIQDLPYDPTKPLTDAQKDEILDYCDHDVDATVDFYNETIKQIAFRDELSEKYDKDFLNFNDTKIGKEFFIMELEKAIPGSCYYKDEYGRKKPRQTRRDYIYLKDAVFDNIPFQHPEFIRIHQWFKQQTITQTKGVFDGVEATVDGFKFVFGTGGLHGSIDPQTVVASGDKVIIDLDVASYYPNIAIANKLYPEHLSETFCHIYKDVYEQRKTYAKKTAENDMLKLALNGVYGDSNNIYSPFYDPLYTMSITINGQLLLCLLSEMLMKIDGLEMIQANTDGVTVRLNKAYVPFLESITKEWEKITGLELEAAYYSRMFIRDVNNYIGEFRGGDLKNKGCYVHAHPRDRTPKGWHQDTSATVVPLAAEAALVRGADIREFITNHDNMYDFMCRAKVNRSSRLIWGEEQIQGTSRVYAKADGKSLKKIMPTTKPQRLKNPEKLEKESFYPGFKGWNVGVANDMKDVTRDMINVEWYIEETKKIVEPLRTTSR